MNTQVDDKIFNYLVQNLENNQLEQNNGITNYLERTYSELGKKMSL